MNIIWFWGHIFAFYKNLSNYQRLGFTLWHRSKKRNSDAEIREATPWHSFSASKASQVLQNCKIGKNVNNDKVAKSWQDREIILINKITVFSDIPEITVVWPFNENCSNIYFIS